MIDWIKWGGIAAIVAGIVLALGGLHHHIYQQGYAAGAAAVQKKFDAAKDAAEQKRLADVQAARAEEQRRTQAQLEIANEATKQAAAAAADAVAAGAAADGLRARVTRLTQPPAQPAIPPLPAQARVSLVVTPSMCLSTCSAGLTKLRESWLATPTGSGSLGSSASATTTP